MRHLLDDVEAGGGFVGGWRISRIGQLLDNVDDRSSVIGE
jgi:hypothetical protein